MKTVNLQGLNTAILVSYLPPNQTTTSDFVQARKILDFDFTLSVRSIDKVVTMR